MTSIPDMISRAWDRLTEGAAPGPSRFSMVFLATTGETGPQVRTVVLRSAERTTGTLRFHTDRRSAKWREIGADPRLSILGYDMDAGEQVRCEGVAERVTSGPIFDAAWASTPPRSRVAYRRVYAPGAVLRTAVDGDATAAMTNPDEPDAGRESFGVVSVRLDRIELLDLADSGHRRAAFTRASIGWPGGWIAP